MTRVSKKDRLKKCLRKPRYGAVKTGAQQDRLPKGFKEHTNSFMQENNHSIFIPKIK